MVFDFLSKTFRTGYDEIGRRRRWQSQDNPAIPFSMRMDLSALDSSFNVLMFNLSVSSMVGYGAFRHIFGHSLPLTATLNRSCRMLCVFSSFFYWKSLSHVMIFCNKGSCLSHLSMMFSQILWILDLKGVFSRRLFP